MQNSSEIVAVVGLGYVGLPLAVAFGKVRRTIGFDVSAAKVALLQRGEDPTGEVGADGLWAETHLLISADPAVLARADYLVVAIPTPVDEAHRPDFSPLVGASEFVGRHMKRGAIVVYESTVYPGATEEVCIPVLENASGLAWKRDFFVGYSPERINLGDREHTLTMIAKVVSGDTPETLARLAALYESLVAAGVHRASSIKVAEAAKVIENAQSDLNIAFMNEPAIIFDKLGIDSTEVLQADGTKWNFLPFRPGLVGGHCIGVTPYYLTYEAEMLGYHPQVILAGRHITDSMGEFVAEKTVKLKIPAGSSIRGARVNVLGITFKENCPDVRNSKVPDIARELESYGVVVSVCDPVADVFETRHEYGLDLVPQDKLPLADAVIVVVAHQEFIGIQPGAMAAIAQPEAVVVDVKAVLPSGDYLDSGYRFWRL